MWFFALLFVASFILTTLLAPKPKLENARASGLDEFQFPRSEEGDPVPRCYGTVKVIAPNTIGLMNFQAVAIKKKVKTGLFSSKKQIIGYQYKVGIDLCVALGPNIRFRKMWFGSDLVWSACLSDCVNTANINLPELYGGKDQNGGVGGTVVFYCGDFDQPQDSYLADKLGEDVPAYVGFAHVVFRDFYWGNSPNIDAVSFEIAAFTNSLGIASGKHVMANGLDINPLEVMYDLYTNEWGNLGIPGATVDVAQWREVALVIWEENNGMSISVANANTGGDVFKEILRQINGMFYQDPTTGLVQMKLIRQDYVIEDLPVLTPAEVSKVQNYTKKLWEDTFNRVRVKYTDREAGYVDKPAMADDFANIRFQGRLRATDVSMPCVYVAELANRIAARELSNVNIPLFQGELEVNRMGDLRPGDPFVLQWPEYNVEQMVLRVRKLGLGTREDGKVTMTVAQDEFAVETTVIGAPVAAIGLDEDYTPNDIVTYVLFELPWFLDFNSGIGTIDGNTRYSVFALAPGSRSIDFFGFIEEGTEDAEVLSNAPYSDTATIMGAIAQFDGFVAGFLATLDIDAVSNPDILVDRDEALVRAGGGLFMIDGEIMAYETFDDNLDGTYTLNNVYRGLLDTGWVAHIDNARLYFFDGQEGFFEDDVPVADFTAYLIDRTISGRSTEAGATPAALEPVGRMYLPAPPDYVTIAATRALGLFYSAGDTITVAWSERTRLDAGIPLEADATGAPEGGTTYRVELVQGVTVLTTDDAIAVATFDLDIPPDAAGAAIVNVWAERDSNVSWSPASFPIIIISADALEIDGDPVFIDGDTVEF